MLDRKGWTSGYKWEDAWDEALEIEIEYEGTRYMISLEKGAMMYKSAPPYETIREFDSKEDFYNAIVFGKPIKQIVDESYLLWIG